MSVAHAQRLILDDISFLEHFMNRDIYSHFGTRLHSQNSPHVRWALPTLRVYYAITEQEGGTKSPYPNIPYTLETSRSSKEYNQNPKRLREQAILSGLKQWGSSLIIQPTATPIKDVIVRRIMACHRFTPKLCKSNRARVSDAKRAST